MHRYSRDGRSPLVMGGVGLVLSASFALSTYSVCARADTLDDLLERLKGKGVLSEQEYEEMKQVRDEKVMEERAERRKRALREAQALEKEEKDKEDSKTTLKGKFRDGFVFESGDKRSSIALTGRIHADYRHFSENSGSAGTPSAATANTYDIRRAYIGLSGKIANDFTFDVTADVAQSNAPQLDVAWVNWAISPGFQFRAGQFKMPMSIEELTSSRFIDFQERSFVNAFVPAKERGITFHGTPYQGLFYGVALSNGAGKNNNESNSIIDSKDFIARLGVNAAEWMDSKDKVLHGALAFSRGEIPAASAVSMRTEGRGLTFFNPAAFSATTSTDRSRVQGELSLAFGPFKFQAERLKASFSGGVGASAYDRDVDVHYLEALWLVTGEKYADAYRGGAYGAIKPLRPFELGSGAPGAWEIGLRLSEVDADDFVPAAGQTNKATATTFGIKWIPVTNVRFYLNYVSTKFDRPVTVNNGTTSDERAITFRTALYF